MTQAKVLATGLTFGEGPRWQRGRLWFSDVVGNVLRAVTPTGQVEVLIEHAAGHSTAPAGSYIATNTSTPPTCGSAPPPRSIGEKTPPVTAVLMPAVVMPAVVPAVVF